MVLEGVEGAGKTTQVRLLGAWLEAEGVPHVLTREPGGTPVGEAVRELVLKRPHLDVPPASELLLILAARAAFVRDVVRPALERGEVVVADRFDASTLAYQGHGRGLDLPTVARMNAFATGGLRPDALVVLDLPVDEGRDRQRRQGKTADRIEREGRDFLERVRAGYRQVVEDDPRARIAFYTAYTFFKLAATEVDRARDGFARAARDLMELGCADVEAACSRP